MVGTAVFWLVEAGVRGVGPADMGAMGVRGGVAGRPGMTGLKALLCLAVIIPEAVN